jgi:hypothetical protein
MADHTFFSTENRHNERQIRILSVGSLVSKPPTKEKRISIKARMPLSGQSTMGAPSWLDHALVYVGQNHDRVSPTIEFKGYQLTFSADNLFGTEVQCPNGAMRKFEVFEAGDEENPDVVCDFVIRIGFSTAAWQWLGQYVGDDAYVKFVPGEAGGSQGEEEDGTLLDDGENEDGLSDESLAAVKQGISESAEGNSTYRGSFGKFADDGDLDQDHQEEGFNPELDTPEKLEYDSGPALVKGKSGPRDLEKFHVEQLEVEQKRGRGRPRKVPLGFTKPLNQPEF